MVTACWPHIAVLAFSLLAQVEPTLDRTQRAKALLLLAIVILLGMMLMFFAWFGARATRRLVTREPSPRRFKINEDDWASKPLHDGDLRDEP